MYTVFVILEFPSDKRLKVIGERLFGFIHQGIIESDRYEQRELTLTLGMADESISQI